MRIACNTPYIELFMNEGGGGAVIMCVGDDENDPHVQYVISLPNAKEIRAVLDTLISLLERKSGQ